MFAVRAAVGALGTGHADEGVVHEEAETVNHPLVRVFVHVQVIIAVILVQVEGQLFFNSIKTGVALTAQIPPAHSSVGRAILTDVGAG
jgi:hypothetical protein